MGARVSDFYYFEVGTVNKDRFAALRPGLGGLRSAQGKAGGAGESRTPDTQFRKLLLYPSELQPRR